MATKTKVTLASIMVLAAHTYTMATAAEISAKDNRDRKIFELLDENGDGAISRAEFMNNKMLVFYVLDRNRDLVLTRDETALPEDVFARVAGPGGKINTLEFLNVADKAFEQTDVNHDEKLDWQEFTALMRHVRE